MKLGSSRVSVGLSGVTTGSKTSSSTGSKSVSQGAGLGGGTTAGVCLRRDMGYSEASEICNTVKTVWKSKFQVRKKCGEMWKDIGKRMGLGFNLCVAPSPRNQVSQILDGAEKNSEKEWNEGVRKDYRILV